ncbi:MAG: phosphatase PAP2 family protein [Janthinobacterium lividum]
MRHFFFIFFCFFLEASAVCVGKHASPRADFGKRLYPIAAPAFALLRGDIPGVIMGISVIQILYATNRPFEHKLNMTRPCGCPGSFPSGHTIMMSSGASFLWFRYGWRIGLLPMIMVFLFMSDRVDAQAHYWSDVLGTAFLYHWITGFFITRRGRRWGDKWQFLTKVWYKDKKPI